MQFGLIVRNALNKSELPVNDSVHLDLGKSYANNNIQLIWYDVRADWRKSRASITTVTGSDEYILAKLFDGFVRNTFRGPSTRPRIIRHLSNEQFFRRTNAQQTSTGNPSLSTFGDFVGFDKQISSATSPKVNSNLANKTINDVNVVPGSFIVTSDADVFSLNDIGLRFERGGDDVTYKIGQFLNTQKIALTTKYRGTVGKNVSYKIGDVGIHVNIQGFVGGQLDSEDAVMDGDVRVSWTKLFTLVTSLSKSDATGGSTIIRTDDETLIIGTMAPGELEIERQTTVLFPISDSAEILQYRFFMKHPILRLDTDRLLMPRKYHRVIEDMTRADLLDWAGRPVPSKLAADIIQGRQQIVDDANNSDLENNVPNDTDTGNLSGLFDEAIDQDFVGVV